MSRRSAPKTSGSGRRFVILLHGSVRAPPVRFRRTPRSRRPRSAAFVTRASQLPTLSLSLQSARHAVITVIGVACDIGAFIDRIEHHAEDPIPTDGIKRPLDQPIRTLSGTDDE